MYIRGRIGYASLIQAWGEQETSHTSNRGVCMCVSHGIGEGFRWKKEMGVLMATVGSQGASQGDKPGLPHNHL